MALGTMGFRGYFQHTLDDRGRLAIPAKWRSDFPGSVVVMLPHADGCLELYPEPVFDAMSGDVAALPRTMRRGRVLRRRYYSRSNDTELDRQGRILIPAEMREKVGLDGQVVIAGGHECLEVWPADRWKEEVEDADETLPEDQEPVD